MKFPKIDRAGSVGPVYRELLYEIAMLNAHKNILEVGCRMGYSTSAFIAALQAGSDFNLTLCDILFTNEVKSLVDNSGCVVSLKETESINVIDSTYDLVFIDGDHSIPVVTEEIKLLLANKTKTIIAHDTHLIDEPRFWGAVLLKAIFDVHPEYQGFTLHNQQEYYLNLGLSIYSRDKATYQILYETASRKATAYRICLNDKTIYNWQPKDNIPKMPLVKMF